MSIQNKSEKSSLVERLRSRRRQIITIDGHGDISNSFLVLNGNRSVVIDCGSSTMVTRIIQCIKEHNMKDTDIALIIVTHTHYDHVKGLKELKEKLENAKIIVHEKEARKLEKGYSRIPPGTEFMTKVASLIGGTILSFHFNYFPAVEPDIIMRGDEYDLCSEEYNYLPGKIIFTPGHSQGSICLLVGKVVIAGDTIECDGIRCFPSFAEDVPELLRSWKKLCRERIVVLLPGHGVRCPWRVFRNNLRKYGKIYLKDEKKKKSKKKKKRKVEESESESEEEEESEDIGSPIEKTEEVEGEEEEDDDDDAE